MKKIASLLLLGLLLGSLGAVAYFWQKNPWASPATALGMPGEGLGCYVINLDRSKARYSRMEHLLRLLPYPVERLSAVDGSQLSAAELVKYVDLERYSGVSGKAPRVGTVGCSLSHCKAWQAFLDSQFQYALILEDDVSFQPRQLEPILEALMQRCALWDIASLEVSHSGCPLKVAPLEQGQSLVVYLTEVAHSGAYLLNRRAARRLLEGALPIQRPLDAYLSRSWESGLKFLGVEPRLVKQLKEDSEIESSSRMQVASALSHWGLSLRKGFYRLPDYAVRLTAQLALYLRLRVAFPNPETSSLGQRPAENEKRP